MRVLVTTIYCGKERKYLIRNRFLCRGKCIDSGEWIEGIAFPHDNNGQVIILRQHKIDGSLIGNEAYPETVSQYTGFNDDNGNPIFEHDIIQTNTDIWLVSWNKGRFIGKDIQDKRKYLCNSLCSLIDLRNIGEKIIVIGNKFDNPELLSREKTTKQILEEIEMIKKQRSV